MRTKLKIICVSGLATIGLALVLVPNTEEPTAAYFPALASKPVKGRAELIPMVDEVQRTPKSDNVEIEAKTEKAKEPHSTRKEPSGRDADEVVGGNQSPGRPDVGSPVTELRTFPGELTSSPEFSKALMKLQREFPDRSLESLEGEAKELVLRQSEASSPKPLEPGETSAMREQHFVVKVRNGRGKSRGEAAVNIEMRSEQAATPKDVSFLLNFDPGMELLEAKAGPALIGRKSISTTPLSAGKVYIQVNGDTSLIQSGVFLSVRFSVVSTEGNTEIFPSQLSTSDRGDAKIGGLGAIMTIDP
jgi:hypothetical protein